MNKLEQGWVNFKQNSFEQYKEYFENLSRKQNPHTLFIGCSDSRLVPNLITNTLPGELFVVRNIANIVPFYSDTNEYVATISAIEFALEVLKVENIVVCGHSNCGGCNALWDNSPLENAPHTKKWLELAIPVKNNVERVMNDKGIDDNLIREWMTEQMNVIEQVKHLFSYPKVKERYENGSLKIYGWYFIIENGDLLSYNIEKEIFEKVSN